MWALVPHGAGLKGLFAGHCSVLRALWCPSTAGVQEASGPRLVVCLIPTFVGRQLWFLFPSTLCWSSLQSLELPWTLLKLYCYIFKYLWDLNCFSWKKNQQNKTTKTPKPTTTKKNHTKKKKEGKIIIHPELQKGLMSLTCFQKQLGNFWLAEFHIPSSLQKQRELDSERRGEKMQMLKIHFCQKSYPTDRKKKKEPVGKPQAISIQVVYGESTRSAH